VLALLSISPNVPKKLVQLSCTLISVGVPTATFNVIGNALGVSVIKSSTSNCEVASEVPSLDASALTVNVVDVVPLPLTETLNVLIS
jgi:hypothetical protein